MGVDCQRHAPAALPSGKRPGTRCIGGLVGPRAGVDECGKSGPHRHSIPILSSKKLVFVLEILSEIWHYDGSVYEDTCNRYVPTFRVNLPPHHP